MIRVRVRTPAATLCGRCRFGQTMEDDKGAPRIYCHEMERPIRFRVAECSRFQDGRVPRTWEFEKTAYIIRLDPKRRLPGFVRPGTSEHRRLIGDDVSVGGVLNGIV